LSLNRLPLGRDHGLLLQPVRYGQGQLGCVTGHALTLQGSKRAYDHTRVALSRCQPRPYIGSAVLSRFELPFSQFSRLAVLRGLCPYSDRRHSLRSAHAPQATHANHYYNLMCPLPRGVAGTHPTNNLMLLHPPQCKAEHVSRAPTTMRPTDCLRPSRDPRLWVVSRAAH
jgi:hypothetical protein